MTKDEIVALTQEYGDEWGTRHAERLLQTVALLAEDEPYNEEAVWLAAYLHD